MCPPIRKIKIVWWKSANPSQEGSTFALCIRLHGEIVSETAAVARILSSIYSSSSPPPSLSSPHSLALPSPPSVVRACVRPTDRPTTCPTRKIAPSPLSRSQKLCNSLGCLVPRKNHYTTSLHFALSLSFSRAAGGNHGSLCLVWKLEAVAVFVDFFEERFVRLIWNGELHKPSKQTSALWMAKVA